MFLTVWDGGGTDTYDFSAYATNLKVDLRPGKASVLSATQLADLDAYGNHKASGNVYNALLYKENKASLIENATGGKGADNLMGNEASNVLKGNGGNDTIDGGLGSDWVMGGSGNDLLTGGQGADKIVGEPEPTPSASSRCPAHPMVPRTLCWRAMGARPSTEPARPRAMSSTLPRSTPT